MAVFSWSHRVTYADCAPGDHVYHSRYLEILEAGRGEFFRHLGTTFRQWQDAGIIFPVVECRVRYKAPARYDDLLSLELRVTAAAGARLNFAHQLLNPAGLLVLEGETFHACTDLESKPRRLPPELLAHLRPFYS
jgi:acyl-CoA thioester hydrolase